MKSSFRGRTIISGKDAGVDEERGTLLDHEAEGRGSNETRQQKGGLELGAGGKNSQSG